MPLLEPELVDPAPVPAPAPEPQAPAKARTVSANPKLPALPGKPIAGMAKLEERLLRAAARIAPPPTPVKATPIVATPITSPPPLVEIQPALVEPSLPTPRAVTATPVEIVADVVPEVIPDVMPEPVAPPIRTRASSRRVSRFDDDDDDYDDRPRRTRGSRHQKSKSPSVLPMVIGGIVLLVLVMVGIYFLAQALRGPSERDRMPVAVGDPEMQFNLPNPDANPRPQQNPGIGFNPFPKLPDMQPPKKFEIPNVNPPEQPKWTLQEYEGDGFKVKLFGKPQEHRSILNLRDEKFYIVHARSKQLRSTSPLPPNSTIEIISADAPEGVTPDLKKIVMDSAFRRGTVVPAKFAGHDGYEHADDFAGRRITTRIVQVGCRVFLLKYSIFSAFGQQENAEDAKKEFFDSFTITFDPKTPAPVDKTLRLRPGPRPNKP